VAVAASVGGRTALRSLYTEGTLKAMRVHYLDTALPAMAFLTIASPGGGVLQGDRLEVDISVEDGAQLHVGTTSATRIYSMPQAHAEARTRFTVARGAYAEFVPDPFMPYAGSRFAGVSRHVVAEEGGLVLAEVVGPGRQARGENLAYGSWKSEMEVRRPDGRLLFRETTLLCPADGLVGLGMLGSWLAIGSLYAVSTGLNASIFDSVIAWCAEKGLAAGCSELPSTAGCWFRVLAHDAPTAHDAVTRAWALARTRLVGSPPPAARRY